MTKPKPMYVAVKALIFRDNKMLLLKRRDPSFWDMPGGRINPGEKIIVALKRELAEELPEFKEYSVERLVGIRKKEEPVRDGNELFLTYFLVESASKNNKLTLSPEHCEYRFFSLEEIDELEQPFNLVYGGLFRKVLGQPVTTLTKESVIV